MDIKVITSMADVEKISPQWNKLFQENHNFSIFEHFDWIIQKYQEIGGNNIILFVVYDDKQSLCGIFPFYISIFKIKNFSFRALSHAAGPSSDYSSFLLSDSINKKVAVKRIVEKLLETQPGQWDLYNIENLSSEDTVSKLFSAYLSQKLYGQTIVQEMTYYIDFNKKFGEAKKISNVKRRFSKLLKKQGDDIQVNIDTQYNPEIMQQFITYHRVQFPGVGFNTDRAQSFFNSLLSSTDFQDHIEISYILNGNELIAGHFGFKHNSRLYYYVPVYNDSYKQYGPGQYLLLQMINQYKEKGYDKFDFLRGGELYKDNWANSVQTNILIFGVPKKAPRLHKFLTNLWLAKKQLPCFY